MRILFLLLAIAATLCAQSPASSASVPDWQSIVNSMLSQNSPATNASAAATEVGPFSRSLAGIKPPPVLVARVQTHAFEGKSTAQAGAGPASRCSVPLLRAQIPTDVNFTMRTVEPPRNKVDRIQVAVPAPACPESPR
jgi:hypothetical protein